MQVSTGKKIYFLSDFHLGVPDHATSLARERRIIGFLEEIRRNADTIFIVGDLFDFWYEYRKVIPKGFVRILGTLASLTDSGIPVYFFTGNHDMWMKGYFESELNIPVYHEPQIFEWNDQKFFVGHGDGLGPGDRRYKFFKKIFRNKSCRWLFGILPPLIGMGIASTMSRRSRAATEQTDDHFLGEEKEWLISYCKETLRRQHIDYFIFGHRHLPIDFALNDQSRYINLGDWIRYCTFAEYDGTQLTLKSYLPGMEDKIIKK